MQVCEETHLHWRTLRYGNSLVNLLVPEPQRPALVSVAEALDKLRLSAEELRWLHILSEGWASPLEGFMTENELLQSLHFEHLVVNGRMVPMPVPIVKACLL